MPDWVKLLLDRWTGAAKITTGKVFRWVNKGSATWGAGMTGKAGLLRDG